MIFVANNQPSEVLEPGKKSFNFPSTLIWPEFTAILGARFLPTFSMRCDHLYVAVIEKLLIKFVAVVSFITDKFIGCMFSKAAIDRLFNQRHFMGRSAFNVSGDRKTRSVCDGHDLGAFAALCLTDSKTPFFAGAKLPSMNASRISMSPLSCRSATNSLTIRLKTPCWTHRWNHLWQVWYGGYRWDISCQGAPVRKIQSIPLKTFRGSRALRPLGSFGGVDD